MSNRIGVHELLSLFEDRVSVSDINAAKCMSDISSSIAKKRMELGLTQKQFADYVQVSQAMVSKWEGGDYNFSIKGLVELAERLELDLQISLKEHREDVQINRLENDEFAYTSFQKYEYTGCASGIISFTEMTSRINARKQSDKRLEM